MLRCTTGGKGQPSESRSILKHLEQSGLGLTGNQAQHRPQKWKEKVIFVSLVVMRFWLL